MSNTAREWLEWTESMKKLALDAMRYRRLRERVSGHRAENGSQHFSVALPMPLKNVMQGSVAEHFDNAMDFDVGYTEANRRMDADAPRINNPLRLIPEPELSGGIAVKADVLPAALPCRYGECDCRSAGCGLLWCARHPAKPVELLTQKPAAEPTWTILNNDVVDGDNARAARFYWGGRARLWVQRKNATEYTADEIGEELQYAERIAGSPCILMRP